MKTIYSHKCKECGYHSFDFHSDAHECGKEYLWVCDNCRERMRLVFSDKGRNITQELTGERCERTKVLLTIPGTKLALITNGVAWGSDMEYCKYHYEEGTCPINVMHSCAEVVLRGCEDPHGMFMFVKAILVTGPDKTDKEEVEDLLLMKAIELTK